MDTVEDYRIYSVENLKVINTANYRNRKTNEDRFCIGFINKEGTLFRDIATNKTYDVKKHEKDICELSSFKNSAGNLFGNSIYGIYMYLTKRLINTEKDLARFASEMHY